VLTLYV
jgi:hypothetical protein